MAKRIFGTALLLVALFMLFGFFQARPDAGGATLAITFLIAVVLPAVAGVYLWWRDRKSVV